MVVRELAPEDVPAFAAWRGSDVYTNAIVRRDLAEHFRGERVMLVAADDAGLGGTLQVVFRHDDRELADGLTSAYLEGLEVREEFRRQGLGTRLITAAVAVAQARGQRRLTVMVEPHNAASLGLFARLGFTEFKRSRHVWRHRARPTVCLEAWLDGAAPEG